jgi:hypothetical protein
MNNFNIQERSLNIDAKKIDFEYLIEKVVFYREIYNLFRISPSMDILWKAELPTTNTGDSYHSLDIVNDKIRAYSWCSYECFIDPKTGKIIEKIFTK